jgi:ankyrin repeat protein
LEVIADRDAPAMEKIVVGRKARKRRRAIGNPNYQDPFGNTLLHGAVVSGDREEVARLLAAGADPGIANRDGRTALHAAEIFGHADIQNLLSRRL